MNEGKEKMMREENEQYFEEDYEEYIERTPEQQREAEKNIAYLKEAKEAFLELEKLEKELESSKGEEKRAKKAVGSEEKSIQDEKDKTVTKKRQEIEHYFDGEKRNNKEKERQILSKRTKQKNEQIQDRIKQETAELKEENLKLKQDIRQLYKKKSVPNFCNHKWYYILFMPDSIKEILQFILSLIITLIVLPFVGCFVLSYSGNIEQGQLWFYYVLIFAIWDIILLIFYIFMINTTKVRYYNTLVNGKNIWNEIELNRRKIIKIENKIKKDEDETLYDLTEYDNQLEQVQKEMVQIENDRIQALEKFENQEKNKIFCDIDVERENALNLLKDKYDSCLNHVRECELKLSNQKQKIEQEYIKTIGKDYIEEDILDELISIIEEEEANNIEEAIQIYNG